MGQVEEVRLKNKINVVISSKLEREVHTSRDVFYSHLFLKKEVKQLLSGTFIGLYLEDMCVDRTATCGTKFW